MKSRTQQNPFPITKLILFALLALLAGGCDPGQAATSVTAGGAKEVVIVFPPGLPKPAFQPLRTKLEAYIKQAPAGTHFTFIEAATPKLVCEITVPLLKYDSPKARDLKLGVPLEDCMAAVEQALDAGGDLSIDLPAIMEHLASLHLPRPLSLLILGSPLGELKKAPGYSLSNATKVPTDDHIATNSAATPWGTREVGDRLRGVSVHLWFPSQAIWSNHFQKEADIRFLAKWVASQSGVLASESADLPGTLKNLQTLDLPPVVTNLVLNLRGTLALNEITVPVLPDWMPTNMAAAIRLATNTAPAPLIPEMRGKVGFGALWEVDCDVDAYVWIKGQNRPVYFGNKTNQFARFGTDMRHATHDAAEWVELVGVTRIEDVDAYLNLYEGAGPVRGKVCLCWEGRTYVADFNLPAAHGNKGADQENRTNSPYWTRIDLRQMVAATPTL